MLFSENIVNDLKQVKPCFFKNTGLQNVFSWKELENLLNMRPFMKSDRVKISTPDKYSWDDQCWLSDVNTYPPSLLHEQLKKYHAYITDCSRVNADVNSICDQLEKIFLCSAVDAHIYFDISENHKGGFGIHHDKSHNFILQIEGVTRFKIWKNRTPELPTNVDYLIEEPYIDEVLHPGDAIFVPMFVYHQALSQTKRMSISFPFNWRAINLSSQDRHWITL